VATHLAFPITVGTKSLATVTQDSNQDVAQSVALLLNTRPGERRSVPEYGLPDPVFDHLEETEVLAVVGQWEPRAELDMTNIQNLANAALDAILGHPAYDDDGVPFIADYGISTVVPDTDGVPYVNDGADGSLIVSDADGVPYFN
jgi:phage baseplate assembly protein W